VTFRFSGSGPGAQAPDGCSVELYRKLPYFDELEDFRSLFQSGTRVLELGSGAGRLTRRLLAWGARVTAVDNCAEMIAAVPESATRVVSDIETLRLEARFDIALLASCLINHAAQSVRRAFVDTAYVHLAPGGRLVLERHDPAWLEAVEPGLIASAGDIAMYVEAVSRTPGLVHMTLRYDDANNSWRHSSALAPMNEAEIESLLSQAGFGAFAWSGKNNRWLRASQAARLPGG
jgi:SAM-dependent methyltransferase